jgi:uncharacterized protein
VRIGVISDTHGRLRSEVFTHFTNIDLIVHAGDIGGRGLLDELRTLAPVTAVWGNTDGFAVRRMVPEIAERTVAGRRLVVLHGHQHGSPEPNLLLDAHPRADIVIYGHTHRQMVTRRGERLALNPGSAGAARFGLPPSVALLEIGASVQATIVEL